MKNQWLFLTLPLIVIIPLFILLSPQTKNVNDIMKNAELKAMNLNSYVITADVITDINLMGSEIKYISNTTTAMKNGSYYTRIITNEPFTGMSVINEQFIIPSGNYSCTDSYMIPFCILDNITSNSLDDMSMPVNGNYSLATYIGTKKVNNRYCDAMMIKLNISDISALNDIVEDAEALSGLKDAFVYSCIDPETGLTLEYLFGMNGVTNYGTMILDVGINVTKILTNYTKEVPDSLFNLPYNIITDTEFEQIMNNTLAYYNTTISNSNI